MPSHDDGNDDRRRHSRILRCPTDPDRGLLDGLGDRYRVTVARSPAEVIERLNGRVDCLVVDGEILDEVRSSLDAASDADSVPIVVLAGTNDPTLVQSVTRHPGLELVYRDAVLEPGSESELDRLCERIDAVCDVEPDLDEPVLELAELLMSAAPDEVDTRVEWGLRSVGEKLDATRCVLYDCRDGSLERTHEWAASEPLSHDTVPTEAFPGFESSLERFDSFETVVDGSAAATLGYDRGPFLAIPVVIEWELEWVLTVGGLPSPVTEPTRTRLGTFGDLLGHTIRRDRRHCEIERKNERLERFASVIRHDLQNPLNVITGFADLAVETGEPADIERISTAASRMESILDDLHTLLHRTDDLGDRAPTAVSDVVDSARATVGTDEVTVEADEVGVVEADRSRLQQVFENLFRSAIEHAGPEASVRVVPIEDGFAVADDGPGIPEGDRDRVFEEGYTDGGTGLGLSIVRTVVEAHGWEVSVTDSASGGARFEISGVQFVDDAPETSPTDRCRSRSA